MTLGMISKEHMSTVIKVMVMMTIDQEETIQENQEVVDQDQEMKDQETMIGDQVQDQVQVHQTDHHQQVHHVGRSVILHNLSGNMRYPQRRTHQVK